MLFLTSCNENNVSKIYCVQIPRAVRVVGSSIVAPALLISAGNLSYVVFLRPKLETYLNHTSSLKTLLEGQYFIPISLQRKTSIVAVRQNPLCTSHLQCITIKGLCNNFSVTCSSLLNTVLDFFYLQKLVQENCILFLFQRLFSLPSVFANFHHIPLPTKGNLACLYSSTYLT